MEEDCLTRILYKSALKVRSDGGKPYFSWLEGVESARKAKLVELRDAKANWMEGYMLKLGSYRPGGTCIPQISAIKLSFLY